MEKKKTLPKFVNFRPLFYGFLSLFLAICTARLVFEGNVEYIVLDVLVIAALFVFCLFRRAWKVFALLFAIFLFGLGWYFVGVAGLLGKTYDGTVSVSGRISDDMTYSTYGTRVTVVLKDVTVNSQSESNIHLTISLGSDWDPEIGDVISFEAELDSVKIFTLGSFNSTYYRDRTPYVATVDADDVTVTSNHTTLAEKFRMKVKSVLYENMSSEHASTAYAVLFGDKSDLDSDVEEAYSSAGVVHLLSVSGLHVSFLIGLLAWVLKKCRVRGWANIIVCGIFAAVYAYLCGFTPSVLRAGIMGVLLFSTMTSGRKYDTLSSLGTAGLILLVLSPLSALDLGFQLSFFCVMAIVMLSPSITKFLAKALPQKVAELFSLSLSASLGIAPIIAAMSESVNLLSFFTNLIVIPIFSVLFPLTFVFLLLVLIFPFLGFLLKVSEAGFYVIYKINQFMGQTNLTMTYPQGHAISYVFYYLALFAVGKFFVSSSLVKFCTFSVLFACFCCVDSALTVTEDRLIGLSYFYNYSESVVVIKNSDKEIILVDMASSSFTQRALSALEYYSASGLFLVNDSSVDTDLAEDVGINIVVRADSSEGLTTEQVVFPWFIYGVGHYRFQFYTYQSQLLGMKIMYDDLSVFILKDKEWDEGILTYLDSDYDIVILGKQTEFAPYFTGKVLTYYSCQSAFSSFEDDGNVFISNDLKRRCLD